jgi:general secretion pathway protein E
LVLSTLHTNDAVSAVIRLLDLGVPHYLIQSTLTGVVAQRLVRTLCPHCKTEGTVEADSWNALVHRWQLPLPERVFRPKGCLECRKTGFLGRTGIYEMLRITPRLRQMLQAALDLPKFNEAALAEGLRPLRVSAAMHVARGVTTIPEVISVLPPIE